jgi:hypothetical protein
MPNVRFALRNSRLARRWRGWSVSVAFIGSVLGIGLWIIRGGVPCTSMMGMGFSWGRKRGRYKGDGEGGVGYLEGVDMETGVLFHVDRICSSLRG